MWLECTGSGTGGGTDGGIVGGIGGGTGDGTGDGRMFRREADKAGYKCKQGSIQWEEGGRGKLPNFPASPKLLSFSPKCSSFLAKC